MNVKFGVIGANPKLRANLVFCNFNREKGELTALCDNDPDSLAAFRQAYPDMANVRTYSDYRELLADPEVEAVFIMVRDGMHEEMAVAALEAGKDVETIPCESLLPHVSAEKPGGKVEWMRGADSGPSLSSPLAMLKSLSHFLLKSPFYF